MEETKELITKDDICSKVYIIRGQQVMLDKDLAEIYGYEVKKLNQQVKRNIERFPEDFMFRLSNSEIESVRSQFVISQVSPPLYAPSAPASAMLSYTPSIFYTAHLQGCESVSKF